MSDRFMQLLRAIKTLILLCIITTTGFSQIQNVASISHLRSLTPGSANKITVEGYYAPNDGGEGIFVWNASSSKTDNGGTIIQPNSKPTQGRWIRDRSGYDYYNARWFGAYPSRMDNERWIQACIDAARDSKTLRVFIPKGVYYRERAIMLDETHNDMEIFGEIVPIEIDSIYPKSTKKVPVLDESQSTILKIAPTTEGDGNNIFNIIRINHNGGPKISGIHIHDLGFDGNRFDPKLNMNPNAFNIDRNIYTLIMNFQSNNCNDIVYENIYIWHSYKNGIDIWDAHNVNVKNLVTYGNMRHGAVQSGVGIYWDGVIAYHNAFSNTRDNSAIDFNNSAGNFYGVDLSRGTGTLKNFHLFENEHGGKFSRGARNFTLLNGIVEDNYLKGWWHQGVGYEEFLNANFILQIENVIFRGNNEEGLRLEYGKEITLRDVEVSDNLRDGVYRYGGLRIDRPITARNLVLKDNGNSANYAGWFIGNGSVIDGLQVIDNKARGVYLGGDILINGGEFYNNKDKAIVIGNHRKVELYNITFGGYNTHSPDRQNFIEISCQGDGVLIHRGLNFSNSKVSPEYRIRVKNVIRLD